jgi:hypothetical protein
MKRDIEGERRQAKPKLYSMARKRFKKREEGRGQRPRETWLN